MGPLSGRKPEEYPIFILDPKGAGGIIMENIRKIDIHAHVTAFPQYAPVNYFSGYRMPSPEELISYYDKLNIEYEKVSWSDEAYIVKNGVIDKRILNEDPFTSYGSILQIFDGQINLVQIIIMIINLINGNGCYIQQDA